MKGLITILFILISLNCFAGKRFWVGSGSWRSGQWSLTSGGTGGASEPSTTDTAYFDINSLDNCDFDHSTNPVYAIDMTGYTLNFTLTEDIHIIGWIKLSTTTNTFVGGGFTAYFDGTGSSSITCVGSNFNANITIDLGTALTITDNLICPAGILFKLDDGSFDASGFNVTIGSLLVENYANTLTMGSGTWTMLDDDGAWSYVWYVVNPNSSIIDAGTSTIVFAASTSPVTFNPDGGDQGLSYSYYNFQFINGSGTNYNFYGGTGGTLAMNSWTNSNTSACSWQFQAGSAFTWSGSVNLSGSAGNVNTVASMSASQTFLDFGSVCWDYVELDYINSTSASYAGCHSVDGGGNTGWTFNNCGSSCSTARAYSIIIH